MASAWPEPASVRPAGTTAGVLDGVEAFAFRTTKGSTNLASIHLVAQPPGIMKAKNRTTLCLRRRGTGKELVKNERTY